MEKTLALYKLHDVIMEIFDENDIDVSKIPVKVKEHMRRIGESLVNIMIAIANIQKN